MIAEEVMSNQSNHTLQSLILSVQQRDMKPIDSLHHGIMCKPLLNSQSLQAYWNEMKWNEIIFIVK